MEQTHLQKLALVCFSGSAALVLVVLAAGLAPTIYCGSGPNPACVSGMSIVMAAVGLCAVGLAMIIGAVGIILSGIVIFRRRETALALLSGLSLLFDLVFFLPRALPLPQSSSWVLIALLVYPLLVLAVVIGWLVRERSRRATGVATDAVADGARAERPGRKW